MARRPRSSLSLPTEEAGVAPEPTTRTAPRRVVAPPPPVQDDALFEQGIDQPASGEMPVKDFRQSSAFWGALGTMLLPMMYLVFKEDEERQMLERLIADLPIIATFIAGIVSLIGTLFRRSRLGIVRRS